MKTTEHICRDETLRYAAGQYGSQPEYLWKGLPDAAVLRHGDNRKWYALFMTIKRENLGLSGEEWIDILDVKCDPQMAGFLVSEQGILPGYHMHKGNWITVLLDGTVGKDQIFSLLDQSYVLTASKETLKKRKQTEKKEWIVPANPRYYNPEEGFRESDKILWKQSSNINEGDVIYLYVTAPVSAILYKCEAVEVDIPYPYDDGRVHMNRAMRIRLLRRFEPEQFPLARLREYGVCAVRGPRGVPASLRDDLEL